MVRAFCRAAWQVFGALFQGCREHRFLQAWLALLLSQPLWQSILPTLPPLSTPADLWKAALPSCKAMSLGFYCLLGR